jgi:hypothetical protein
MLRISVVPAANVVTVKLEGALLAAWHDELRRACDAAAALAARSGVGTQLDLSAVAFVDVEGAGLIHALLRRGIGLGPCSSFVAELLHLEHA